MSPSGPWLSDAVASGTYQTLSTHPINAVQSYGVDNTGTTSAVNGILAACQASLAANSQSNPSRGVYLPAGVYLIDKSLNFSTLSTSGLDATYIRGWSFICDPGAVLLAAVGVTNTSLISLLPPGSQQFYGCSFRFGTILDPHSSSGNNGLFVAGLNDSTLEVLRVAGITGSGVLCQALSTGPGIFNNRMSFQGIESCGTGFATLGNPMSNAYGFQGNHVSFSQVFNNGIGINIDNNGVGNNSAYNTFVVGAVEHSTQQGIMDYNGTNMWQVANTNSNGSRGYVLAAGAGGIPDVRGFFTDGTNLNGLKANIVNNTTITGAATPPAVPAANTPTNNPFDRPAMVYVAGGAAVIVSVDGVSTGLASGGFRLVSGESISLGAYTTAPTWTWFLTN